jgi:hypothetical protein
MQGNTDKGVWGFSEKLNLPIEICRMGYLKAYNLYLVCLDYLLLFAI